MQARSRIGLGFAGLGYRVQEIYWDLNPKRKRMSPVWSRQLTASPAPECRTATEAPTPQPPSFKRALAELLRYTLTETLVEPLEKPQTSEP